MRKDLSWSDAHRWHRKRGRRAIAASVAALVVGSVLSLGVAMSWRSASRDAALRRFEAVAAAQPAVLEATAARYVRALRVTRGYLEADRNARLESFATFAATLRIAEDFPGLRSLEFVRAVPGRVAFPVRFVAPETAAPGLLHNDLSSDPVVAAALAATVLPGAVTITPPAPDEWNRPRILMVTPVHRDGDLIGWVGGRVDPLPFEAEVVAALPDGIHAELRWADGIADVGSAGAEDGPLSGFVTRMEVEASGASWSLSFQATDAFAAEDMGFPWLVFAIGLVPAMLASTVLFFLGRSRMRALILAERLARDLAVSEARAGAVMEAAVEAIVTMGGVGLIESVNPAAELLFGWTAAELVGQRVEIILPALEMNPNGGSSLPDETERMLNAHRRDGSVLHVDVSLAPASVDERPLYVLIARDATQRKLHEDQLTHQATHDPLTALANRQLFDELLVRAVYRADRSRSSVAVLYVDLDGFKDVNDIFGHAAGDRVLAETARRLEATVRPGDVVARLGGDEFVVLCENLVEPRDAEKIAQRIVGALGRAIPVASGVAQISASVGVAAASDGEGAASLIARSDEAMYEAKRAGKNGYQVAGPVAV